MKIEKKNVIILFVFLFGFLLRLISAVKIDLWVDEASTFFISKGSSLRDFLIGNFDPPHNFLYYLLMKGIITINTTPLFLRLPSLIFSLLNIFLVYKISKNLKINKYFTCISVILFALSPYQIEYSWWARMYSMVLFFTLFSIFSFLKYYRSDKLIWGLLFASSNILGFYADYSFFWYLLVINILCFVFSPKMSRTIIRFLLFSDLMISFHLPVFMKNFNRILDYHVSWIPRPDFNILKATILWNFGIRDYLDRYINNFWIIIIVLLIVLSIVVFLKENKKLIFLLVLLAGYCLPIAMSYFLSHTLRSSIFLSWNFISISMIPVFLLSFLVSSLLVKKNLFLKILSIFILIFILITNLNLYLYNTSGIYFPRKEGGFYKKVAYLIRGEVKSNRDSIILIDGFDSLFYYYFDGYGENQRKGRKEIHSLNVRSALNAYQGNLWIVFPLRVMSIEERRAELNNYQFLKYFRAENRSSYKISGVYKISHEELIEDKIKNNY